MKNLEEIKKDDLQEINGGHLWDGGIIKAVVTLFSWQNSNFGIDPDETWAA